MDLQEAGEMDTPRMTLAEMQHEQRQAQAKWRIAVVHRVEDFHGLSHAVLVSNENRNRYYDLWDSLYGEGSSVDAAAQILFDEFGS